MKIRSFFIVVSLLLLVAPMVFSQSNENLFKQAEQQKEEGNYKDALDRYIRVIRDNKSIPENAGDSLRYAVECLNRLGRIKEADALIENAVTLHGTNWQVLHRAAETYYSLDHYGFLISGEFARGRNRGGGQYANSYARDRVRALQLMKQALDIIPADADKSDVSHFCFRFADMIFDFQNQGEHWRLQYATDLSVLPDYEEGGNYYDFEHMPPPVNAKGDPIFYYPPPSFEQAANDGERYRWLLDQAAQRNPKAKNEALWNQAMFLYWQFGVQTMVDSFDLYGPAHEDEVGEGPFSVQSLKEDETMASLANGIKRFPLPEGQNHIAFYKQLAETKGDYSQNALEMLAQIFENRRQYPRAVQYVQELIKRFPESKEKPEEKLEQLTGAMGRFHSTSAQPAGKEAEVGFVFRNGKTVHFKAVEIKLEQILEDEKAFYRDTKEPSIWYRSGVNNLAYRLINQEQKQYLGKTAAEWDLALEPLPDHFNKRIMVKTPLKKAGAYLLTAKMENGYTVSIVIWIMDTALVQKPMDGRNLFFASDAITGEPLEGMKVDCFGYRWDGRQHRYITLELAKKTDRNGLILLSDVEKEGRYQWIVSASNEDGRLAYFTPSISWNSNPNQQDLNRTRALGITDRPVYRPGQTVHYKFWVRQARYDLGAKSMFAGKSFNIKGTNPQRTNFISETKVADEYGGIEGKYTLPDNAPLGVYTIRVDKRESVSFRVEEYKKPEFEVTVKAPEEPVALGETIPVEIKADYYFGAPVAGATVSYKILRSEYRQEWFPRGAWDWLYGAGYWWFAYDYDWYPGWTKWGCNRPRWSWWWHGSHMPPEVVGQGKGLTSENGILKLSIATALAKELRGGSDHKYEITVEVTDQSRRTIVGKGAVIAAREPFKVYAWVNKGHYQVGDVVSANFSAQTPDGKPVTGKGKAVLYKISRKNGESIEKAVKDWNINMNGDGRAELKMDASQTGQYRLSLSVTDSKGRTQEGGYLFCVMGDKDTGRDFVFDYLELVPDLREYAPGDKVRLRINTRANDSTVLLFVRPENGVYPRPQILRINGNSTIQEIEVSKKDMPNFFVEALTIHDGKVYSETRQIVVPPEKRVYNVEVLPSSEKFKPGEKAKIDLRLTDISGNPFMGSTVLTVYDKAVEYISGGSNVQDIRDFFWKWVRRHYPATAHSLDKSGGNLVHFKFLTMQPLGVFGNLPSPEEGNAIINAPAGGATRAAAFKLAPVRYSSADPEPVMAKAPGQTVIADEAAMEPSSSSATPPEETVHVRTEFADTAFWAGSLETDANGFVQVEFDMPENLTAWKIKAWAMGHGTRVGQGEAEVMTSKDLLLRLQAPRFFVEGDEVVLSANIHNYLDDRIKVKAILELDGDCLTIEGTMAEKTLPLDPKGEKRVDWRVKVVKEGEAIVRMKAITGQESDAMEMRFPVYVHGMEKTDTFSGVIRPDKNSAFFTVDIPGQRRPEVSRLEVRYSPTLAGAMIDALPYLASYPYGCTEQTLNRFLPTVITWHLLESRGIDMEALRDKHTNLNAQEMGDSGERAAQWQLWNENPVYDPAKVRNMAQEGIQKLASMQNADGGWGWFSGWGERSYPHTTATVVRGLLKAREAEADVPASMMRQGLAWLKSYQDKQLVRLKNAKSKTDPYKTRADNLDAYVFMILAQEGQGSQDMQAFLMRDKNDLSVYGLTLLGTGLHAVKADGDLARVMKNIGQYLVCDGENQTCHLEMGNRGYWWYWYGDEMEAHAWYLKLLALSDFEGRDSVKEQAAGLVKYILNNRKHAARWSSTRNTALCIEALADYLNASKEDAPDMKIAVYVDGGLQKEVAVNQDNLLDFDNVFVLEGPEITAGKHEIRLERKGKGPVYFNGWMTNFTLEQDIKAAGLEIKVDRKVYRLTPVEKTVKDAGAHGQVLDQKVEKYQRTELSNLDMVQSGDLVEVELTIQSKNDYEYVVFEDFKPAGFEPVEVRSGYSGNGMGAYTEYRDERVAFFCQTLARGTHSLSYRMRAEIPGRFSALPTKAHAMYAPELKANSNEIKLQIED